MTQVTEKLRANSQVSGFLKNCHSHKLKKFHCPYEFAKVKSRNSSLKFLYHLFISTATAVLEDPSSNHFSNSFYTPSNSPELFYRQIHCVCKVTPPLVSPLSWTYTSYLLTSSLNYLMQDVLNGGLLGARLGISKLVQEQMRCEHLTVADFSPTWSVFSPFMQNRCHIVLYASLSLQRPCWQRDSSSSLSERMLLVNIRGWEDLLMCQMNPTDPWCYT